MINICDFGAKGDNSTSDLTAIKNAFATLAEAGGGELFFPAGKYIVPRDGNAGWALSLNASNVLLRGVKGQSWLKHPAGMTAAQVSILLIQGQSRVTIRDMGFDGNWGNAATTIAKTSHAQALPNSGGPPTINVASTTDFSGSGTMLVVNSAGSAQSVTYTGKTATSFTGCSGGTGTMLFRASVGYVDANTGINHSDQGDPHNHGIFLRGSTDVLVENCLFRQIYGDGMWMGHTSTDVTAGCVGVKVRGVDIDMAARSDIALGGQVEGIHVSDCRFTNIFATAFDTEPGGGGIGAYARDILIEGTLLNTWWNPGNPNRGVNSPLSISGSVTPPLQTNLARTYRVRDCVIRGGIQVTNAYDVNIEGCRVVCDWVGKSFAPITFLGFCDDVWVTDNHVYCRTQSSPGTAQGCIALFSYGGGASPEWKPAGITVARNKIHPRNGNYGITVFGTGGVASDVVAANLTGKSTSVTQSVVSTATRSTGTTLTDSSQNWATNNFVGVTVTMGGHTAVVTSNMSTELKFSDGWSRNFNFTADSTTSTFTATAHRLSTGNGPVRVWNSGGALPAGLSSSIDYWIIRVDADHFKLAASPSNANNGINVTITTNGTGTQSLAATPSATVYSMPGTLTDNTKLWATNEHANHVVVSAGVQAVVQSNTMTQLVLGIMHDFLSWHRPLGDPADTPVAGASYVILPTVGIVNVVDNYIDCTDDGEGQGSYGIWVQASRAGMRVRLRGNEVLNANPNAIWLNGTDTGRIFQLLEVTDNHALDNQITPTCASTLKFSVISGSFDSAYFAKMVLRNNQAGAGVAAVAAGLSAGKWLIDDGTVQQWAGYGDPNDSLTALPGASYLRLDGVSEQILYIKETGTGNTGWVPYGGSALTTPSFIDHLGLIGANFDPLLVSSSVTLNAGQVLLTRVRAYGSTITKIAFSVATAIAGGTHVYVGLFKPDGTQSAEMVTATVDTIGPLETIGLKNITLANTVTVTPGDDLYVAVLVTGTPTTALKLISAATAADRTNMGPQNRAAAFGSGLTAMPSTVTFGTSNHTMPWVGIL